MISLHNPKKPGHDSNNLSFSASLNENSEEDGRTMPETWTWVSGLWLTSNEIILGYPGRPAARGGDNVMCHVSPSLSRLHCTGRGVAIKVWLTNQRSRILVPWPIIAEDWQAALVRAPAVNNDVIDSRDKNCEGGIYFHHKTTIAMMCKVSRECTITSQLIFSLLNCYYAVVWMAMQKYLNSATSLLCNFKQRWKVRTEVESP